MSGGNEISRVFAAVREHAERYPDSPALLHRTPRETKVCTYAELAEEASRFSTLFEARTPENSIVPMYLSKSAACVAAMLGALGAGRAFACLNKKLRAPQLKAIVGQTRAATALIDGPGVMVLGTGVETEPELARTEWWLLRDPHHLPVHDRMASVLRGKGLSVLDLASPVEVSQATSPSSGAAAERVGCCLFTSGSTGSPKGVLVSSRDLDARAEAEVRFYRLHRKDVLLSLLPFSFDVGLNQLLSGLMAGCTLVLLDSWLPADIRRAVAECRVTGVSGVPSIWQDMTRAGMSFDTSGVHASLRYLTVSGGDLLPHQLDELPSLAPGCGIYKTYGQTEAFRPTALPPEAYESHKRSIGRPFDTARVYVVSDGRECAPGEVGEIVHTGLGTMLGYLDGQDPQGKLRPNPFRRDGDDAAMAVFTGDMGFLDEEGYLFLKGRRDAMLKIDGNRVYPQEIAVQLAQSADVSEAQVVGVPDASCKTRLFAFLVLAPGASLDLPSFRRDLLQRLPSYMVPAELVILDALPRTASGKPDLPALKAEGERRLAER